LQRERVGERELADAQAYLAGNFPLTIETPDAIATQVLNNVFFELPVSEIGTFSQRVQSVTPDDIQRVARAYVFPDRLSIVLVGNASGFTSQLKSAGFPDFEVIPIDQLDLSAATLRKDRPRAQTRWGEPLRLANANLKGPRHGRMMLASYVAQDSRGDSIARDLIEKAIRAKGGLAALKRV